MGNKFEIFVYHRIGPASSLDGLTVSGRVFEEQMKFFREHRKPMALKELVRRVLHKKTIPHKAVAVTFDDGYRDTLKRALPVLRKYKIPATVFITTGYIDGRARGYKNAPMMSWGMVKKLQKAGIEIGAHTMTHPNLTSCTLKEVRRQVSGSQKRLEQKLGSKISLFAYPYGGRRSISKKIRDCVQACGFSAACTTLPGMNDEKTDLFTLRRQPPIQDEIRDFAVRLNRFVNKRSSSPGAGIQGLTPKAARIWALRYKRIRKWL
jgi:peptidoglycan/xylan/chitin deacetylase (PgdA/CDA1 family)